MTGLETRTGGLLLVAATLAVGAGVSSAQAPSAPARAAAASEYRLALGDSIRITVFQNAELSLEARITEAGVISYPLLGSVSLAGLIRRVRYARSSQP